MAVTLVRQMGQVCRDDRRKQERQQWVCVQGDRRMSVMASMQTTHCEEEAVEEEEEEEEEGGEEEEREEEDMGSGIEDNEEDGLLADDGRGRCCGCCSGMATMTVTMTVMVTVMDSEWEDANTITEKQVD